MMHWHIILIPLDHALQAIEEAVVHSTPFLPIVTSVAPALRLAHAVPLIIDFDACIPGMGDITDGDRVRGSDGITGGRGHIASGTIVGDGGEVGINFAQETLWALVVGSVKGIIAPSAISLTFDGIAARQRPQFLLFFRVRRPWCGIATPATGEIACQWPVAHVCLGDCADILSQQFCLGGANQPFGLGRGCDLVKVVGTKPFS